MLNWLDPVQLKENSMSECFCDENQYLVKGMCECEEDCECECDVCNCDGEWSLDLEEEQCPCGGNCSCMEEQDEE